MEKDFKIENRIVRSVLGENSFQWHKPFLIMYNGNTMCYFQETIMGCNIMQIYNISGFGVTPKGEFIMKIIECAIEYTSKYHYPVGYFICTLGENYRRRTEKALFEAGFRKIAHYLNLAHGEIRKEYQSLYGFDVNEYYKKKNLESALNKQLSLAI